MTSTTANRSARSKSTQSKKAGRPPAPPEILKVIGQRVPLLDALEKVTGSFKYAVDISLPGMLVGKILRSPHPHARMLSIDVSKAAALPGVAAVLTPDDVPQEEWGERAFNHRGRALNDQPRF